MVLGVHRNQGLLFWLFWDGEKGGRAMEVGVEGDYNLSLHCHHQNDSCIKMGSDESHFNVSLIIIIMYIYHALINALSAHMIHINLNMTFYTHVEHSPTKTIYIKYYTKKQNRTTNTHNDCSRNGYWYQLGWKYCEKRRVFSLVLTGLSSV